MVRGARNQRRRRVLAAEIKLLPQRIFAGKIFLREDLVDDRDERRARRVIRADHAPANDRCAERFGIVAADGGHPRLSGICRIFRLTHNVET